MMLLDALCKVIYTVIAHGAGEEAKVHTKAKARHPDHSIAFLCIRLLKMLKLLNHSAKFSQSEGTLFRKSEGTRHIQTHEALAHSQQTKRFRPVRTVKDGDIIDRSRYDYHRQIRWI